MDADELWGIEQFGASAASSARDVARRGELSGERRGASAGRRRGRAQEASI